MLAFREGVGLRRMWFVRWVMGVDTYFQNYGGLREVASCARFIWLFDLSEDRWFQQQICLCWDGMRVWMLESGSTVGWLGRRSWLGSVRLFFLKCSWRITQKIHGIGSQTGASSIKSAVCISSSLARNHNKLVQSPTWFGIRMFL